MSWLVNIDVALGVSVLGNSLQGAASCKLPLTLSGQLIVFETAFTLLYGFIYEARWLHGLEVATVVSLVSGVGLAMRRHGQGFLVRILDLVVHPPFVPCRDQLTFLCLAKEK